MNPPPEEGHGTGQAPERSRLGAIAVGGLAWSSLGVGGRAVLRVAVLAVLARLITPAEFGLVTAAQVVVSLSATLAEMSLGPAVVRCPVLTRAHVRVAWTFLVFTGAALWGLVIVAAPAISSMFGMPDLVPILRVMACVFFVRNLTVSDFLLSREMRFEAIAKIGMLSYVIGYGVITVVLAALGFGAWAIVAGAIGEQAVRVAASYRLRPHPLIPLVAWGPGRDLLGFGGGSTLAGMGQLVAHQVDNVVVGRFLGPVALGLYGRAYQLMAMPAQMFLTALTRVLFPVMSAMQEVRPRLRSAYLSAVGALAMVMMPLSIACAVVAPELILLVLGPDWLPLHGAFSIIVLGMFFRAVPGIADCVSMATGAVYRQAWRKWAYATAVSAFAIAGSRWGMRGVAGGVLAAMLVNTVLQTQLGLSVVHGRWTEMLRALRPAVVMSLIIGVATFGTANLIRAIEAPGVVVLAVSGSCAAATLLITGRVAPRLPGLGDIADLLTTMRRTAGPTRLGRGLDLLFGPGCRAGRVGVVSEVHS